MQNKCKLLEKISNSTQKVNKRTCIDGRERESVNAITPSLTMARLCAGIDMDVEPEYSKKSVVYLGLIVV